MAEPPPSAEDAAWRAFCARLADMGSLVLRPDAPAAPLDRAEGYRFLARLVRLAMLWNMEAADVDHPLMFRQTDEVTKPLGGDAPDILYWAALVDGRNDYRISARGVDVFDFGIGSKVYRMDVDGTARSTGELEGKAIDWGPGGDCEIIASRTPKPGAWLPMTEETNMVMIRQTQRDRAGERPGWFQIERIDAAPPPPPPYDAAQFAAALARTAAFVEGHGQRSLDFFAGLGLQKTPNQIVVTDQQRVRGAGGNPLFEIQFGYFRLEPDEAWVLEFTPPDARHWSFSLYNWWMESLDYRTRRTWLSQHDAVPRPDGRLVIVVSEADPGAPNWLDTAGHREGYAYFRWVDAAALPRPASRVVKLAELR